MARNRYESTFNIEKSGSKVGQQILGKMTPIENEIAHEVIDKGLLLAGNYIHLSTKLRIAPRNFLWRRYI